MLRMMIDLYPVATEVVCGNCVLFDVEELSFAMMAEL